MSEFHAAKRAERLVDQLAEHLRIVDGQAMIEGDDALYLLADALQSAYNQGVSDVRHSESRPQVP